MPIVIADDVLRETRLTEAEIRTELAYRLHESGRLSFESALKLSELDASELMSALEDRGIRVHGPTDATADEKYTAGYQRVPEDTTELVALLPHLPLPREQWESHDN